MIDVVIVTERQTMQRQRQKHRDRKPRTKTETEIHAHTHAHMHMKTLTQTSDHGIWRVPDTLLAPASAVALNELADPHRRREGARLPG